MQFDLTALYTVATKTRPKSREAALKLARAGKRVTRVDAIELVDKYKERKRK